MLCINLIIIGISFFLIYLLISIYQIMALNKMVKAMEGIREYYGYVEIADEVEGEDVHDTLDDEEGVINDEIKAKHEERDERIRRIKEELDQEQVPQKPTNTAETLHPGVENLPHDSIIEPNNNYPDVEHTD